MTYAKVLFLVGGVALLGTLGAEKPRAQPSPVDCDRYATVNAWLVARNGDLSLGHFARSSFYEKNWQALIEPHRLIGLQNRTIVDRQPDAAQSFPSRM
jgi:hypothetical protein